MKACEIYEEKQDCGKGKIGRRWEKQKYSYGRLGIAESGIVDGDGELQQ